MTMTHNEALDVAFKAFAYHGLDARYSMEAAIRAYIEARWLVLVPKAGTPDMHKAWYRARDAIVGGYETDISPYEAMLAAAPDPFKDGAA